MICHKIRNRIRYERTFVWEPNLPYVIRIVSKRTMVEDSLSFPLFVLIRRSLQPMSSTLSPKQTTVLLEPSTYREVSIGFDSVLLICLSVKNRNMTGILPRIGTSFVKGSRLPLGYFPESTLDGGRLRVVDILTQGVRTS